MKKRYLTVLFLSFFLCNHFSSRAQVNLPYTLSFTSNDAANWADGIAQDGDGGTSDINGLTIQIYTAGTDHTSLYTFADAKQSILEWHDNSYYYSNSSTYTGITSGPSIDATDNGVPAMVIKSADNSVNFSLQSIQLYDWGYTNVITIETYDNGVKKGSVDFTPDASYNPTTVSQSDLLTPSVFNDIDEIRFFPKSYSVFNLSFNNISLAAASTLPVTFTTVRATKQTKNIALEWNVANQTGIDKYEVQRSADGITFSSLGTENVKNNSGASASYKWIDENPLPENNFYRIKSIDKTGLEEYSSVAKVDFDSKVTSLVIYPNPVRGDVVHLQINHLTQGTSHLQLINSEGKVVIEKELTHPAGTSNETINLSRLPKGIYMLLLTNPGNSTIKRTIVH